VKPIFAVKEDLSRLLEWCKGAPEFQKKLSHYIDDRDDTSIVVLQNDAEIIGVALLKVKETEKMGSIWFYGKGQSIQYHPEMMRFSLKWLKLKGAKDYTIV
jgi:hypothetical protein